MKIPFARIGWIALALAALAVTGNQQAQAQPVTFAYQFRLDVVRNDWPNPTPWDGPAVVIPIVVIPPDPCPPPFSWIDCGWHPETNCPGCGRIPLGTNQVIVDKGLCTMPITIPTYLLLSASNGLYLEFSVSTNGSDFTTLFPPQRVSPTPYAAVAQSVTGPIPASQLIGSMPTGMLTGIFSNPLTLSNPSNVFAGDGSLLTHLQASSLVGTMPTGMLTAIFSSPLTLNNPSNVFAGDGSLLTNISASTLDLRGDRPIRVAGAGVGSTGPVFIHRATPASVTGHITTIDHPLANGDPNAILLVTHNWSADTASTRYETTPVGVWYNGSQWTIFHEDTSVPMPNGRAFNVMIIKP